MKIHPLPYINNLLYDFDTDSFIIIEHRSTIHYYMLSILSYRDNRNKTHLSIQFNLNDAQEIQLKLIPLSFLDMIDSIIKKCDREQMTSDEYQLDVLLVKLHDNKPSERLYVSDPYPTQEYFDYTAFR